jgi:hypothetical protein
VRDLMGGEAEALLQRRFAIINLWRPIRGPLLDSPLALCDARSLEEEYLVASDLKYPDRTGETYSITYNPNQRYYYSPGMQPDEAVLIRCFDSALEGRIASPPIPVSTSRKPRPTHRRARCARSCSSYRRRDPVSMYLGSRPRRTA